jgi:cyclase
VKTVEVKNPKYVGDPINAVKIFNEKEADELVVLDIGATVNGYEPDYKMIANLAAECRMPLCYGGGVRTPEQAKHIIGLGVEKVAISAAALADIALVTRTAEAVGRQSVVVVLDVRKKAGLFAKGYEIFTRNGTRSHKLEVLDTALRMQAAGAGEIVVNSIDRDGRMKGYDLALAAELKTNLHVPLTILGGAGSHQDIESLLGVCGVVGASAGSLFVFKGPYRAVLINYPNPVQRDDICRTGLAAVLQK